MSVTACGLGQQCCGGGGGGGGGAGGCNCVTCSGGGDVCRDLTGPVGEQQAEPPVAGGTSAGDRPDEGG